jgi:AcrR family transcriptional regulator
VSSHSVILGGVKPTQRRARPLPPDDRRREIVEAVIPLLLEKGSPLSTREIADAAGVAEGTVFSVFPDKASVIVEAVKATVDPKATIAALTEIPRDVPLEQQLETAAELLMDRGERIGILVGVLRTMQSSGAAKPPGAHRFVAESHAAILAALTELFARHEERLKPAPGRAAVVFWGFVFANVHALIQTSDKLGAAEIVDLVLHGIAAPDTGRAT